MIKYKKINKWEICNLKNRKIYVLVYIYFDKNFTYFNTNYEIIKENNKNIKLGNI